MGISLLSKETTGLLVVDVQEKLFPHVERGCETLQMMKLAIKGSAILGLPVVVAEQYPKGLGETVAALKGCLPDEAPIFPKTTFSCLGCEAAREHILNSPVASWVVIGFEAHVCILQTAKALLRAGKEVVILNDAITSRSIFDYSTAVAELRDCGARITSTEAFLFELVGDSNAPEFKALSQLVK